MSEPENPDFERIFDLPLLRIVSFAISPPWDVDILISVYDDVPANGKLICLLRYRYPDERKSFTIIRGEPGKQGYETPEILATNIGRTALIVAERLGCSVSPVFAYEFQNPKETGEEFMRMMDDPACPLKLRIKPIEGQTVGDVLRGFLGL